MSTVLHPMRPTAAAPQRPAWHMQERLAPVLVGVTLAGLVVGLVAQWQGAPGWLVGMLAVGTYAAGSVYAVQAAWAALRQGVLQVDLLMVLAALGAASIGQWAEGATLLFLFSLANVLEDYALGSSRRAVTALMAHAPDEARVRRDGREQVIRASEVRVGDVVLVRPGERLPADGMVIAGASAVDQASITGESLPVDKTMGDTVYAGTLNGRGALDVRATSAAQDTVLARVVVLATEAQQSEAPTQRALERFERRYVWGVLAAVALVIVVPPLVAGADFVGNFYRAMVLLTVLSPCALVISTPAAFLSAIAAGARRGVLFKGGTVVEHLAGVRVVAFDKTGTLTEGRPAVAALLPVDGVTDHSLLTVAASAEARSEHPLAAALVAEAAARGLARVGTRTFEALTGVGARAVLDDGRVVLVRSPKDLSLPPALAGAVAGHERDGHTVVVVLADDTLLGAVALADPLRAAAAATVSTLHARGLHTAMLTGDNPRTAASVAARAGVGEVLAGLLPPDKVAALERLRAAHGPVAMVGDGVNDAPALVRADVGIAMGTTGTDVALESADVVLVGDRLALLADAIVLARRARQVVWTNIVFALVVVVLLAIATFAVDLPLPLGVLGHEGSTLIVVVHSLLRLLVWPPRGG